MKRLISILVLLFLLVSCSPVATETSAPTMTVQTSTPTEEVDPYEQERQLLIEEIKSMGVKDEEVLGHGLQCCGKYVPTRVSGSLMQTIPCRSDMGRLFRNLTSSPG
jgi:hypothetical protein